MVAAAAYHAESPSYNVHGFSYCGFCQCCGENLKLYEWLLISAAAFVAFNVSRGLLQL